MLRLKRYPLRSFSRKLPAIWPKSFLDRYFALEGRHVQFNVVETANHEDTRIHPGKYPDLAVRVAGYRVCKSGSNPDLRAAYH